VSFSFTDRRTPATIACYSDDLRSSMSAVDNNTANLLADSQVRYLGSSGFSEREPISNFGFDLGSIAGYQAWVRSIRVRVLVGDGPVLIAPLLGLLA
jgi:hypothetical protein